jgi:hypothetical protein
MVTSDRVTVITAAVSAVIKAYRVEHKLTRAEFAAAAWEKGAPQDFTATVVGALETGRRSAGGRRREITLDELVILAATMGAMPLEVLGEHATAYGVDGEPAPCPRCSTTGRRPGPVEAAVRADLEEFGDLLRPEPSLAATALVLAEAIDTGGDGGRLLPRLTKELRATLEQIVASRRGLDPGDDDFDDELGDDLDEPE